MRDEVKEAEARFASDISEHQLTIVRDDGLYRHLRCKRPEGSAWGFNVVTWPGYLYVGGDSEDYVFSREPDMVEFFEKCLEHGVIDYRYWAQKLRGPSRSEVAYRYSSDLFVSEINRWRDELAERMDADEAQSFREAVTDQILESEFFGSDEAMLLLREFHHDGISCTDYWEWDLKEFDFQFVWACNAIRWAVEHYREQKATS